ncbi:MAG TPA: response regulator, partial [Candidatus Angelobacter sp.]|nr:response regulator [Candidatus Angelobacter sp.]
TRTPIIAMTANAMKGDDQECFAAGMDGYIAKPVSLNVLQKTIAGQVLGKSEARSRNSGDHQPQILAR